MSTSLRESKRSPGDSKSTPFRRDIQGLRAIAVIVVVLDHLLEWPSGGFVGVDVFFVISGFLITGLLLREHDRSGKISLGSFYRRRIRRIAPAATLVLVVTVAASSVFLNAGRTQQTFWDAVWSFFFAGNWRFAASGTDYFQATGPVSPLQHFWSLAVEEQFYFVWPALMLLTFFLASRAGKWDTVAAHRALGSAMIVIVVLSFGWAYLESVAAPTWAYFSTFSRAWELGIGALLAVFAPSLRRLPAFARPFIAWAGLAGIALSLFVINDTSNFPAPWALVPVLATSLVIAAGTGGDQRFLWPVTNPLSVYVGEVSYSLYLWHFPVIIFLEALLPGRNIIFFVVASLSMLFLAVMSYELVESPIRRSQWLEPRTRKSRSRTQRIGQQSGRTKIFGLVGVLVIASTLGTVALSRTAPMPQASGDSAANYVAGGQGSSDSLSPHESEIAKSASLTEWPALTPSIGDLAESQAPEWRSDRCLDVDESDVDRCVYGSGDKLAVLLGDSVAISYMPGLRAALEAEGWRIQSLTRTQCPGIFIPVRKPSGAKSTDSACNEHHIWVQEKLAKLQPDLVIVSNAEDSLRHLDSEQKGEAAAAEWKQATVSSISVISSNSPRTVILAPPPQGKPITQCATQLNRPSDCNTRVGPGLRSLMQEAEISGAEAVDRVGHEVVHVNTTGWFCTSAGDCPPIFGTTPIRADGNHLTAAFSVTLAEQIREALL